MSDQGQNQNIDAPSGDGGTPAAPPAPVTTPTTPTSPKVEMVDGKVLVDGKKYVLESDLIAAKESLRGDLEKAQSAHNDAIDAAKLEADEANRKLATANAELEKAKQAGVSGAISEEEITRLRQEATDAQTKVDTANTSALDYRRKYIMAVYNIPVDSEAAKSLETKDSSQLDAFEEALKAVGGGRGGAGNYALGGGGGSAPVTEMDRAKSIIESTPVRGVRNPTPAA